LLFGVKIIKDAKIFLKKTNKSVKNILILQFLKQMIQVRRIA